MLRPSRIALSLILGAVGIVAAVLFAGPTLREGSPDHGGAALDHDAAAPSTLSAPATPAREPAPASMPAPAPDPMQHDDARLSAGPSDDDSADPSASDPADAAFVEAWGEPTPELLRASIEAVVADLFVDRTLAPAELERATQSLLALRTLRAELDALPMEPAHAARRRALVEELGRASETFHAVMDMSPSEFTTRAAEATGNATGGGGIDRDLDPEYVPDDDFLPPRGEEASAP